MVIFAFGFTIVKHTPTQLFNREVVRLEEKYSALSAASEADLKKVETAVKKAQDELATVHEQHKKVMADAAAAREAAAATARTERNSALKELKSQHAAELAQVQVLE